MCCGVLAPSASHPSRQANMSAAGLPEKPLLPTRAISCPVLSTSQANGYISCRALAHMLTSRKLPWPVWSRSRSAAIMASAATKPVAASMTGQPLHHMVVGAARCQCRVTAAVARNGAVHDARVDGFDLFVAKAMAFEHPGAVVVHHQVGLAREVQRLGPARRRGQVDGARLFARVERRERVGAGSAAAHHIAAPGALDLDHLGAHPGQLKGGERAGDDVAEVEHTHPAQRLRRRLPCSGAHRCMPACAALTRRSNFAASACMKPVNSCGDALRPTTVPVSSISLRRAGSSNSWCRALNTVCTIATGVPAGAHSPNHASSTRSPAPSNSSKVGTSGKAARRFAPVTASARTLPDCTGAAAVDAMGNAK